MWFVGLLGSTSRRPVNGSWPTAPVVVATHARVALGDEVAQRLGARCVLVLLGERPGLSAPDSLGTYLTWHPRPGRRHSERNCVSNIRPPHGLALDTAARTLAGLLHAARRRQLSGVRAEGRRLGPRDVGETDTHNLHLWLTCFGNTVLATPFDLDPTENA